MSEIFVEQVAVLVLLHRYEEQAGAQLQTKFSVQFIFIRMSLLAKKKKKKKTIRKKRERKTKDITGEPVGKGKNINK